MEQKSETQHRFVLPKLEVPLKEMTESEVSESKKMIIDVPQT